MVCLLQNCVQEYDSHVTRTLVGHPIEEMGLTLRMPDSALELKYI